jgi:hypothetical protein
MNDFEVGNKLVKDKDIKQMTMKQLSMLADRLQEEIRERFKDQYCMQQLYGDEGYICRSLYFGKGKMRNKAWLEQNKMYTEKI